MTKILVVPTEKCFERIGGWFQGFRPMENDGITLGLEELAILLERKEVEENPNFKQLIPYIVVMSKDRQLYAYQRPAKNAEKRLAGKLSIGVGGHVENETLEQCFWRELHEEVMGVDVHLDLSFVRFMGFINDDTTDVGKVHLGLLYLLQTTATKVVHNNAKEIIWGGFKKIPEIETLFKTGPVEPWSAIALQAICHTLRI